ncbi:MAG: SSU ribosomal protein S11P [Candidatus Roizmanbacteria bacterium GW2011_GWA2_36_23]|uniref:Small ribosomal subunit protein uS11 n=1 Tax=Candidatus Roizmanbacteria bacterium GW2011_GWA2_36_23 TaxID=1618480 RepID=A0A0G0E5G9_9BACT|nr:MAG: SSU ribosomal protein S11P [Candidatus Roizmanbacteria bacterium GW2011_GWA2_36_23]
MAKKTVQKTVENGKIFITATFNNTMVTITDETGKPIVVGSCGMYGFVGTRKSTPYAATVTTESSLRKAVERFGFRVADVFVKGIGPGREASLRAIKSSNVEINRIVDITPVPHNGVRPPKIRRV